MLAGCAALAVGTLQGPVQAFPAVNELLDRGGDAGDVIVNLHAQLNMLGGLMVILIGLTLASLRTRGGARLGAAPGASRSPLSLGGVALYYAAVSPSRQCRRTRRARPTFVAAVAAARALGALVLVPAALACWSASGRTRARPGR